MFDAAWAASEQLGTWIDNHRPVYASHVTSDLNLNDAQSAPFILHKINKSSIADVDNCPIKDKRKYLK